MAEPVTTEVISVEKMAWIMRIAFAETDEEVDRLEAEGREKGYLPEDFDGQD